MLLYMQVYFCLSSPFLYLFGNDRVICHTGADVIPGDDGDA